MSVHEFSETITDALLATTALEWITFITALLYVILATLENSWCWLFGILCSALSVYLSYNSQLFLESGLNIFYVIIGFYGWYQWLRGSKDKKEIPITFSGGRSLLYYIAAGTSLWLAFWFLSQRYTSQALPYLDSFITGFSLVATYMTTQKKVENWIFWIVIDALAVYLYASRELYLIAVINVIYTFIAGAGYLSWRKKIIHV
jgi:nicotinamide mononucleotide transporter